MGIMDELLTQSSDSVNVSSENGNNVPRWDASVPCDFSYFVDMTYFST